MHKPNQFVPGGGSFPPEVLSVSGSDEKTVFGQELLEKYADVMIWGLETARKSTGGVYKPGDIVVVQYELDALPLAEPLHKKLLEKGMIVIPQMNLTSKMELNFYRLADDNYLKFLPPWSNVMHEHLNGRITLRAPSSLTHLAGVDPKRIAATSLAAKPLMDIRHRREATGEFGWTLCMMPTQALADQAKLSLREYAEEIIAACYLDKSDPVAAWENLKKEAEEVKRWLKQLDINTLHIQSPNTDLRVKVSDRRKWLGVSGHNIPSFEIFTSPDWRGTEGTYYSDMPSFRNGNYVKGVRLEFKKGEAVKIEAEEGEDFARKQMEMDEGARRLGEVSLTDKRFSPIKKFMANTLFDENVGGEHGNCHIAVGASFSDTYTGDVCTGDTSDLTEEKKKELGFNDSTLHWDLINAEKKTVTAYLKCGGSIVIYEDGKFRI